MRNIFALFIFIMNPVLFCAQFSAPQFFMNDVQVRDINPDIKTDGNGVWLSCWVRSGEGIFLTRSSNDGLTWSVPYLFVPMSHEPVPKLCTDGDGNWLIVYHNRNSTVTSEYDVYARRSSDHGVTWSDPVAVNSDATTDTQTQHDAYPIIDTDGQGAWMVIWQKDDSRKGTLRPYFSVSSDLGQTWSPMKLIIEIFQRRSVVSLVSNKNGNWMAMTGEVNTSSAVTLFSHFGTNTEFNRSSQVNKNSDGSNGGPIRLIYQAGQWTIYWAAYKRLGMGSTEYIAASITTNTQQGWSEERVINPPDGSRERYPLVTTDGDHQVNLFWDTNVIDADGTATRGVLLRNSQDGGITFGAAESTPIIKGDGSDLLLSLAGDRSSSGTIILVWSSVNSLNNYSRIRYTRSTNIDQSNAVLGEDWLQYSTVYPPSGGMEKSNQLADGRQP